MLQDEFQYFPDRLVEGLKLNVGVTANKSHMALSQIDYFSKIIVLVE